MARKHGCMVPEAPTAWLEDPCGRTNKVYCNTNLNFKGGTMFGLSKDEDEKGSKGYGLRKGPLGLILTEEFIEEDDYNEQILPEKKRRLTSEQVNLLEKTFEVENKLESETKGELARKLGLHPRQIATWFQNRRARWKTKQLERDYDQLKALYDAVLAENDAFRANHDSVVHENKRLRKEVVSLTEKLRAQDRTNDPVLDMSSPTTSITVPKPVQAKFEADQVNGSCTVPVGPPQPQSFEDHLSIESSSTSAIADGQLPSAMKNGESCFPVGEEGESYYPLTEEGSYHGGHNYMILSDEGDGGYFSSIYGENAVVAEHQPSDEEGECDTGFWIWH